MNKFKLITYAEFKELRYSQWLKQEAICPILKQPIYYEDAAFDHKHRTKSEKIGEGGKGLLRGVIHKQANVVEGKIANMYKRYGLHKFISLPDLLRNIADYIESPPMKPEYVHPNEREFEKLGKRDYNRIRKWYFHIFPRSRKIPEYPKSGKMNQGFKMMLKWANELEAANKLFKGRKKK